MIVNGSESTLSSIAFGTGQRLLPTGPAQASPGGGVSDNIQTPNTDPQIVEAVPNSAFPGPGRNDTQVVDRGELTNPVREDVANQEISRVLSIGGDETPAQAVAAGFNEGRGRGNLVDVLV